MGLKWGNAEKAMARGFTLVELMIVLAIAAIVTVFGIPELTQFTADQRVRVVVSEIQGDLMFARADALNNQRRVVVEGINGTDWTAGWRVCVADPVASPARYDCTASPEIMRVKGPTGGRIRTCGQPASLGTGRIAFRADGRIDIETAFAGGDYVRVSDNLGDSAPANDKIRSIYFGPSGRMNTAVENGGLGGAINPCP
ncbi:MAG TPA: GspH/FimT family pseudopilin [Rhodocyclaceae bacterium]|nr:GspH/FimT family pseudopilin [Rhodocyclaceae bacterium]HNH35904.1 GspH/FimT family pseudopilin [Rhodocyclaceae bacterium]